MRSFDCREDLVEAEQSWLVPTINLSRLTSIHGKDLMDAMGAGSPSHPGLDLRGDIRLSCN